MTRMHGSVPIGEEASFIEQGWRNEFGWYIGNGVSADYHLGYFAIPASWGSAIVNAEFALNFGWEPVDSAQYIATSLATSAPAPTNYTAFGRTGSNSRGIFRGTLPIFARWAVTGVTQIQVVLRVTIGGGGVDVGLYRVAGSIRAFPT